MSRTIRAPIDRDDIRRKRIDNFDYLEALYEQTQYKIHYLETYMPTDQKNLPQQLTAATTE